jgi:hypothetical protein
MPRRGTLRREIRQLRRDLRSADLRSVDLRFQSVRRDTDLARGELNGRLDLLNELRGNVISREEFSVKVESIEKSLDALKDEVREQHGKGIGLDKAWGYAVGALGITFVGIDVILRATGH